MGGLLRKKQCKVEGLHQIIVFQQDDFRWYLENIIFKNIDLCVYLFLFVSIYFKSNKKNMTGTLKQTLRIDFIF